MEDISWTSAGKNRALRLLLFARDCFTSLRSILRDPSCRQCNARAWEACVVKYSCCGSFHFLLKEKKKRGERERDGEGEKEINRCYHASGSVSLSYF